MTKQPEFRDSMPHETPTQFIARMNAYAAEQRAYAAQQQQLAGLERNVQGMQAQLAELRKTAGLREAPDVSRAVEKIGTDDENITSLRNSVTKAQQHAAQQDWRGVMGAVNAMDKLLQNWHDARMAGQSKD